VHFDEDNDAEIPGVDIVKLPGVDVAEDHPAPQIVVIDDLDIPTPDLPPVEVETAVRNDPKLVQDTAAPVEPAPVAQPAEPQGARRSIHPNQDTDKGIRSKHARFKI
jgi:hypothetical protein